MLTHLLPIKVVIFDSWHYPLMQVPLSITPKEVKQKLLLPIEHKLNSKPIPGLIDHTPYTHLGKPTKLCESSHYKVSNRIVVSPVFVISLFNSQFKPSPMSLPFETS